MISVAAVGAAVGLAILALLLLFGVLVFAGAYAKVVLDPGLFERPPSVQERRRGYLALGISLAALAGIVLIWVSLR